MAPLEGLKVIDLSATRVGAQVSQTLADFGADVVCIEPPGGAPTRALTSFAFLGRGKRSVVLDLEDASNVDRLKNLTDCADVVIETFRPGVADRMGIGYDDLSRANPRLVYASVTGWGRSGPYKDAPGYEGLVLAKLGVFDAFRLMATEDRPPYQSVPWCSFPASQLALQGILAALVERDRSGCGQHIETSLVQGFMSLDTWNWYVHLVNQRYPDAFPAAEPWDADGIPQSPMLFMLLIGLTRDGKWLQFAESAPHLFQAFMKALGLDWMFTDPQWKDIPAFPDQERRLRFWNLLLEGVQQKSLAEWEAVFERDPDVYAELIRSGSEVLEHPQLVRDGMVVTITDPERGEVRQPGPLVVMSKTPARVDRAAPTLGSASIADVNWSTVTQEKPATDCPSGLPLAGMTVLELAVLYAAPYGSTVLTDLGARVIKVEPLGGDLIRNILPMPELGGVKVMQGKESICVDTSTPEGVAIVHRLAERADLVLQGYRAGVAERHGIDAETLHGLNPELVYLHAPGYGAGPPNGHRPAFAPSIGAAGGIARANLGDNVPERPGLPLSEVRDVARRLSVAGMRTNAQADGFAAMGVATELLLGLVARERGSSGQTLLGSMLVTCAHAMADHVIDADGACHPPAPDLELRGPTALYRVYDASDGWIFLAAPSPREWARLAHALEPFVDLVSDTRFQTEDDRRTNDRSLSDALSQTFSKRAKDEWEHDLLAADVGCVAVSTEGIEDVLLSDAFGERNGFLVEVDDPTFDKHLRLAPLMSLSRSSTQAKPAVLAGSSTDAILEELGFTGQEISDLRDRHVVR